MFYSMKDLKDLRASMKRKREQAASERASEMPKITFTTKSFRRKKSKLKPKNMFRFLPLNLRIRLENDENMIIMLFFLFLSSKAIPRPFFSRIPIEVFHDETFSAKLRDAISKKRIGKITFLNFKLNNEIHQIAYYDDYSKLCSPDQIIFAQDYATLPQKKTIHVDMIKEYNKAFKKHIISRQNDINSWAKERKTWKIEFVAAVFEKNENFIKFSRDFQTTMKLLQEWKKDDMFREWKRFRSLPDLNLNEFEKNDVSNDEITVSIKKIFNSMIFKKRVSTKPINVDDLAVKANKAD